MKTRNQKGITLIALIITIIVMLILVGVSVSVALNTGLFKTAQGVAKNTQLARQEETALSSGRVTINGKTYLSLEDAAKGEWAVEEKNGKYYFEETAYDSLEEALAAAKTAKEETEKTVTHKVTIDNGTDEPYILLIDGTTTVNTLMEGYNEKCSNYPLVILPMGENYTMLGSETEGPFTYGTDYLAYPLEQNYTILECIPSKTATVEYTIISNSSVTLTVQPL